MNCPAPSFVKGGVLRQLSIDVGSLFKKERYDSYTEQMISKLIKNIMRKQKNYIKY